MCGLLVLGSSAQTYKPISGAYTLVLYEASLYPATFNHYLDSTHSPGRAVRFLC
jgi:hypothetical protein